MSQLRAMARRVPAMSVVAPVDNSADALPDLVARLEPVLQASAGEFELVFVNDDSRDNSRSTLVDLCARHRWIRAIDLTRNCGQHGALLCGIRATRHAITVTLDDDLQHPPEEIPTLLDRLHDDVDVVYGAPEKSAHGWLRKLRKRGDEVSAAGVARGGHRPHGRTLSGVPHRSPPRVRRVSRCPRQHRRPADVGNDASRRCARATTSDEPGRPITPSESC